MSICYILKYFYIISEITVTISQNFYSSTNKCQLDKRKGTRLCFEPTKLTSPVKIKLLSERLNHSAIVFVKAYV